MIVAACVLAYVTVTLIAARRLNYYMRMESPPDGSVDAALLGLLSFLAGIFWPLILPASIVMWRPRKTPEELRGEITKRDQRIAELEREAGLR